MCQEEAGAGFPSPGFFSGSGLVRQKVSDVFTRSAVRPLFLFSRAKTGRTVTIKVRLQRWIKA